MNFSPSKEYEEGFADGFYDEVPELNRIKESESPRPWHMPWLWDSTWKNYENLPPYANGRVYGIRNREEILKILEQEEVEEQIKNGTYDPLTIHIFV